MITYLIYAPLNFIVSIICYITNPFVLLFCREDGELPGFLSYWQTWDNSCNPSDIKDCCPRFLQYDWDRHYQEYEGATPELSAVGRTRWFCRVIDPDFTIMERLKRYACRVLWLTRNCGYGFAFWLFGKTIQGGTVEIEKQLDDASGKLTVARVYTEPKRKAPFLSKNDRDIIKNVLRWCIFLGWKIDYKSNDTHQAMIAGRVAVRFGRR